MTPDPMWSRMLWVSPSHVVELVAPVREQPGSLRSRRPAISPATYPTTSNSETVTCAPMSDPLLHDPSRKATTGGAIRSAATRSVYASVNAAASPRVQGPLLAEFVGRHDEREEVQQREPTLEPSGVMDAGGDDQYVHHDLQGLDDLPGGSGDDRHHAEAHRHVPRPGSA